MPIVRIKNPGALGVVKDLPTHELPPEAWSDAQNIRFVANKAGRMSGHEDVYNITVSAVTATQTIAEAPWFAYPVISGVNLYWVYAGKNNVHVATVASNSSNINKLDSTASATLLYSADPSIRWNGAALGDVLLLNNGVDTPQAWVNPSLSKRLQDMQWDISASAGNPTSWATRTAGAVTAKVFRAYREFGIAMDLEEGGTSYPRRLRWSHPSTKNNEPASWEDTRTDMDAGYRDFNETGDIIIDGLQMRDLFIVYKEQTSWIMQYIGGRYIHAFRPLFATVGVLTRNCVTEVDGNHIVVTPSDVVLHNGQEVNSIIENKYRQWLFSNIDTDYYENTFIVRNYAKREIWICFPESGTSIPYWCNKALVYNWQYRTWTVRDLTRISHITEGVVQFGDGSGASNRTWDAIIGAWDASSSQWGERGFSQAARTLLACQAETDTTISASATSTPKLLKMNAGTTFDGSTYTVKLERQGLPVAGVDRHGNPVVDLQKIKRVKAVWPYFNAATGATLDVYVGSQMDLNDAITWSGPFTFTVGTDNKINCRVVGRYISVRFQTTHSLDWYMTGYDLDIDVVGKY